MGITIRVEMQTTTLLALNVRTRVASEALRERRLPRQLPLKVRTRITIRRLEMRTTTLLVAEALRARQLPNQVGHSYDHQTWSGSGDSSPYSHKSAGPHHSWNSVGGPHKSAPMSSGRW